LTLNGITLWLENKSAYRNLVSTVWGAKGIGVIQNLLFLTAEISFLTYLWIIEVVKAQVQQIVGRRYGEYHRIQRQMQQLWGKKQITIFKNWT
jgi:hypothetical protein